MKHTKIGGNVVVLIVYAAFIYNFYGLEVMLKYGLLVGAITMFGYRLAMEPGTDTLADWLTHLTGFVLFVFLIGLSVWAIVSNILDLNWKSIFDSRTDPLIAATWLASVINLSIALDEREQLADSSLVNGNS